MEITQAKCLNRQDLISQFSEILETYYHLPKTNSLFTKSVTKFEQLVNQMVDDLTYVIEWPYVDKMYRDTYYHYYASKKEKYSRVSVKISMFVGAVDIDSFYDAGACAALRKSYRGFFSIRPTFPNILGRNVINPLVFGQSMAICSTGVPITVNGVKFQSRGFPHASQDTEMITCAETTVWAIMEYFGNKYSEYRPLLPSYINKTLGKFSLERLLPSKGLTAGQISYALKDYGFGVKMYSAHAYGSEFMKLLRIYIESGIPVVGAISNGQFGHAVNIVGRNLITDADLKKLPSTTIKNNITLFELSDVDVDYVYVDDNYPAYRKAPLGTPSIYYADPAWHNCRITSFIVPLYPKIYLEAGEARKKTLSIIDYTGWLKNQPITIRTFLASSRSFKNHINFCDLPMSLKKIFNSLVVPKFIWVTEIYNDDSLLQGKCDGIVILDATEPKKIGVICCLLNDTLGLYNFAQIVKVGNQKFDMFNQNLQSYEP